MTKEKFSAIKALYEKYGNEKYMIGEDITQMEHALQAASIAKNCGAPDHIIIGMLLHDIGQLIGLDKGYNSEQLHQSHDDIGAKWLQEHGLPSSVTDICKYHTLAKIIICDKDKNYLSRLSQASQESYFYQKRKHGTDYKISKKTEDMIVACRYIDDMSKINNYCPGKIDDYFDIYNRVITNGSSCCNCDAFWIKSVIALII
jgi:predicted HD phosphohydrolase